MSDFEPTPPGDVVDPDEIPETDLSDFESQVVEQFNAREAQSSAASDEVSADASPSPGSEAAAPAQSGAALDFVEPVDDEQPVEPAAPEPAPQYWEGFDDTQQAQARSVYDWYAKLDETAVATVDAALSGQYVLVPSEQIEYLQNNWDRVTGQSPEGTPDVDDEMYDPEDPLAKQVGELQQKLEGFEQAQMQAVYEEQLHEDAARIDSTYDYWRSQHPYLTEQDCARLQNWVIESGAFETYAQFGPVDATMKALDQALFMDPDLRMKAVQPLVDERVQQEMLAAQEQAQRGMRASAVSGSSNVEPDSVNMSPEEAMVEEIRRSLEGL